MQLIEFAILLPVALLVIYFYIRKMKVIPINIEDVILNHEELKHHAKMIARKHSEACKKKDSNFLVARLNDNYNYIFSVYKKLNEDSKVVSELPMGSEWLLDNFYIIEQEIKKMLQNTCDISAKDLNIITEGELKGYPRIFAVALELVSHTDGRIDKEQMEDFINSYQSVSILNMSELWSLNIMIKLAIIEKIRNSCKKIMESEAQWKEAEQLRDLSEKEMLPKIKSKLLKESSLSYAYIEHLVSILKSQEASYDKVINFINSKLMEQDLCIDKVVEKEHQEEASHEMSIGNCISSLKNISSWDWKELFKDLSAVERILETDPSGIYPVQDYNTKNFYRHEIKKIAKITGTSEVFTAKCAVKCASDYKGDDIRLKHIGYYIVSKGKNKLLSIFNKKIKPVRDKKLSDYLLPIILLSAFFAFLPSYYVYNEYNNNVLYFAIVFIVSIIPSVDASVTIINYIISHMIQPSVLPKIEYTDGIPENASTIVIVPCLLSSVQKTLELIEQLEVTYLSNKNSNIYFAILGDFKDCNEETLKSDDDIRACGLKKIRELNKKYSKDNTLFYFFIRKRMHDMTSGKWLGWERKRGAIMEFIELISGSDKTSFETISSSIEGIKDAKYVITLDADTILPIGAAEKLIGTITHPLNKAVVDDARRIVTEGYGLIQPRIGINIESTYKTLFAKIFSGQGGIDAYSQAVSDVYQDMFGEGIYTGKGIFEIDTFRKCLKGTIPENSVLSHDLIEGSFVRCGLATDIELIDNYPEKYGSFMMRLKRWVRGDWQLLPYLFKNIPTQDGYMKNPLSSLSRYKIIDNLRRSIVSINILLIIVLSTFFPYSSLILVLFAAAILSTPIFISIAEYFMSKSFMSLKTKNECGIVYGVKACMYQAALNFVFLPYHAYVMLDAIIRTLYRLTFSRKNLLEWVTAADVERNSKNDLKSYFAKMSPAIVITAIYFALSTLKGEEVYDISWFISAIWILSPFTAYHISRPCTKKDYKIGEKDFNTLRRIARKTWSFYEDYADAEDNYLPVDNIQEEPVSKIAHRTSPTNIGFLLMSIISARDLGYITTTETVDKIRKTLSTIDTLDKWNGHLYNWYDTKTLKVLRPAYVSTVDSGNFISYLICVRQALSELKDKNICGPEFFQGINDTLSIDSKTHLSIKVPDDVNVQNIENSILNFQSSYNMENSKANILLNGILSEIKLYFPLCSNNIIIDDTDKIESEISRILNEINYNSSPLLLEKYYTILIERINSEKNKGDVFENIIADSCITARNNISSLIKSINSLCSKLDDIISNTKFDCLYDKKQNLFSIGYNIETDKLTNSYYDLLCSEARIASYIAVSRREVPVDHWFKLGRSLVIVDGYKSLVSWTGTMFEYFMPAIVMKNYENTILSETYKTVIRSQMKYGKKRNAPWGTSESGYYMFDLLLNYQYKAFGVPELGLKRGLNKDMVISPYSSTLALSFAPDEAIKNINRLLSEGLEGKYGFYESVDYTLERLPFNVKYSIVQSFMAHHQGMILTSLNNFFNRNVFVKRFHSYPAMKTGELLLQEKIPTRIIITKEHKDIIEPFVRNSKTHNTLVRKFGYDETFPMCHILSNGSYSVLIDNRGDGFSKKDDIYVSKFRYNDINNLQGQFIFIKNLNTNEIWSSTFHPLNQKPDYYQAKFYPDKAEFIRKDGDIETQTEICVSPEDNCEVRKIIISNHSEDDVTVETTSFMEPVLSEHSSESAHPVFNKLFITSEFIENCSSLLFCKRPKDKESPAICVFHTMKSDSQGISSVEYETDRAKFLGRCRDIQNPVSFDKPLSNTCGAVIDPSASLRQKFKIAPYKSITVTYTTGLSSSKEKAVELAIKYSDTSNISRAFELSYIRSLMETRFLNITKNELECFDNMISHIVYLSPVRRRYADIIDKNTNNQTKLWSYGISGDLPIVSVIIRDSAEIDEIKNMVKAHEYLKSKGLKFDLVILSKDEGSYFEPLLNLIKDAVLSICSGDSLNTRCGIFIINCSNLAYEDECLFYAASNFIIDASKMNIKKQLHVSEVNKALKSNIEMSKCCSPKLINPHESLLYYNGIGGFETDGCEYTMLINKNNVTPAPWSNIICGKNFGCLVTESGLGYTWCENSRENKITPWYNDPVTDTQGETLYIVNKNAGNYFSNTPLPSGTNMTYKVTHSFGNTSYECESEDLYQKTTVFVPLDEPVKIISMTIKNNTNESKDISLYYYIKPVLGVASENTAQHIVSKYDDSKNVIYLKNNYVTEYSNKIAFVSSSEKIKSFTCDDDEFLGNGSMACPDGISYELSGKSGTALNPCSAINIDLNLKPNDEKEICFMLGECESLSEIDGILQKYSNSSVIINELHRVKDFWKSKFDTLKVSTPDESANILLNSHLIYQTIACRLWARTAYYQCGGAYGFRDQLQDALCMADIDPDILKEQILLSASHQFESGDVLHWWHHQSSDKGIRTKFSDDLLWLPYACCEYTEKTGDYSILDDEVSFIEAEPLKGCEDERYIVPNVSDKKDTIFNHCIRAIDRSLKFGAHGIPLMGSGDWNDGMNTVGNKGKGESVWLGWFLYDILNKFSKLSSAKGQKDLSQKYLTYADKIRNSIEENAWDGSWYTRAFFDDGSPLGSSANTECKIDSIAQSWAAISGGGDITKVKEAVKSAENYLVKKENGIILLFTPPFDKSKPSPGYIKGYIPGVRENGGQYTHAACWFIYALTKLGMGDKAYEYFSMINPINHSRTPMECVRYKVEPYVIAADVYNIPPHEGRGGWTWYTGSAGWMYKTGIEGILGFMKHGSTISINPCIPGFWKEYSMRYKYKDTIYNIHVLNPDAVNTGVKSISLDGNVLDGNSFPLTDDGKEHNVTVTMK